MDRETGRKSPARQRTIRGRAAIEKDPRHGPPTIIEPRHSIPEAKSTPTASGDAAARKPARSGMPGGRSFPASATIVMSLLTLSVQVPNRLSRLSLPLHNLGTAFGYHPRQGTSNFFQRHDTRLREASTLVTISPATQPTKWQTHAVSGRPRKP